MLGREIQLAGGVCKQRFDRLYFKREVKATFYVTKFWCNHYHLFLCFSLKFYTNLLFIIFRGKKNKTAKKKWTVQSCWTVG